MIKSRRTYLLAIPLVAVAALVTVFVWGQLQPKPPGFAPTTVETLAAEAPAVEAPAVKALAVEAGPVRFTIDARDKQQWAFFDFDSGTAIETDFEAQDWDLAFRRTKLRTNSGETHPAGTVGVANLGEVDFATATAPPAPAFEVDALMGEDGDELRNPAIEKWYRYNFVRHVIVARPDVYLVRTSEGREAIVRFDSYYCDDQTPGCVTFNYRFATPAESGDIAAR